MELLIETYPAYDVYVREADADGFVHIVAEELLGLKAKGYYSTYRAGSVVSYALECGKDPIAKVQQAIERKEPLHWIIQRGVMLTSHKRAAEKLIAVQIGMRVIFEGRKFELVAEANNNIGLKAL